MKDLWIVNSFLRVVVNFDVDRFTLLGAPDNHCVMLISAEAHFEVSCHFT